MQHNDGTIAELRRKWRQGTEQEEFRAVLGDEDGNIFSDRKGYVKVRMLGSNNGLAPSAEVRGAISPVLMQPGMAVIIGRDRSGQLAVLRPDFESQIAQGREPILSNPGDPRGWKWNPQDTFNTAYCHSNASPDIPSMYASVRTWPYIYNAQWLNGYGSISLASLVPGTASHHLLALVYVDADNTIQAAASTSQVDTSALDLTDAQEAYQAAINLVSPVWYWRLYTGQTTLDGRQYPTGDRWLDGRLFLCVDDESMNTNPNTIYNYKLASTRNLVLAGKVTIAGTFTVEGVVKVI